MAGIEMAMATMRADTSFMAAAGTLKRRATATMKRYRQLPNTTPSTRRTMVRRVLGVVFGSCLYRFIVAVALRFNVPAAAMKLVSALIVAIAISMPAIQNRLAFEKRKHAAQKKEAV